MKFILSSLLLILIPLLLSAQTDLQMTQHMMSRINYNPAATGASNFVNICAIMRKQWNGFNGAPSTQLVNLHNYIHPLHFGVGLSLANDQIGIENQFNLKLSYAYHVWFSSESYLSVGIAGGFIKNSIDGNKLNPDEVDDPVLNYNKFNKVSPDFDAGIEYSRRIFSIGASVTHINHPDNEATLLNKGRHYYFYTRFNFELAKFFDLHPAAYAVHNNKTTNFEINTLVYYQKKYWMGVSYRIDDQINSEFMSLIAGLEFFTNVKVGYSYDFNLGKLARINNNSHEIMLSFKIPKYEHKTIRTPRFFE